MFSVCKQTHPPTAVEHSLTCNFFNRHEKSLVVGGSNVLRVFRLIPDVDPKKKDRYVEGRPPKMKLECLASFTLWGNIMSMASATLAGSSRDALLISFRDAKLSLVEYDPETHDLRTLSLHYFEEDEIRGGWTHNEHRIPLLRVDPEGRCAVMLGYGRRLIVLPFRRDPAPEDADLLMPSSMQADVKPLPHQLMSHTGVNSSNKAPVLASYSIPLRDLDEKMDNVIDVQFLHGYYEPTLLVLYEPVRTFPGRLAVRKDTCAMVAISLSLATRVHPSIWSVSGLPFDCLQAVPVRKPLGGTLLLATNSVLYLNQSVPPYGVAVNSIADTSSNFPLKEQPGLKITLEGAQACFLSNDRLVLSLHGGELYVLSLMADSMRSVRGFHFEKAAASVLTTCISLYEDNYLFLGSRLGNSLLLRFTEKDQAPTVTMNGDDDDIEIIESSDAGSDAPGKKKRRMDTLGDCMASNVAEIRDPDELEVYGREDKASVQITSFSFEVCDSLLNIGPCGNVSIGEPAFLSEEFSSTTDPDLELVTTAGHGKNGALCVLQRSLRPQVATTFELPGVIDMWTVAAPSRPEDVTIDEPSGTRQEQDTMHAFLVLSRDDSSMVLQTGQEINEVDNSGFSTQGATVFAGNLGLNKYIVQVCQMGVRLLLGIELLQHIPLDLGSPVIHASCADPYLVLLFADGQIIQLALKEARQPSGTRLTVNKPNISCKTQITALCAYRDVSGIFSGVVPGVDSVNIQETAECEPVVKPEHIKREIDDEDELLYGDTDFPITLEPPAPEPSAEPAKKPAWWLKYLMEVKPTYWLILARNNGNMEIYSLPDCKLNFLSKGLSSGPRVLVDNLEIVPLLTTSSAAPEIPVSQVKELMIAPLGHLGNRPLLLVRLEDEVLVYQAFHYPRGSPMPLRFKRLQHSMLTRERKPKTRKKQTETAENTTDTVSTDPVVCQLRYFRNIAGYNGVFICGPSPYWVFLTSRGELRAHPMHIDGPIPCFAPFHNVNCSQGFLYFNNKSELRICVLPTHLSYDAPWPCRKVPLRCTPHFVSYHLESKTYCVITSNSEPSNKVYKFNGEDKELSVEKRNDRFPFPPVQRFSVLLFSPVSWEVIPNTRTELDEWEHVTCLKNVSLAYEGAHSGLKGYIAVGTNYNYGEDITSRGRILIYDVIEVVPEPGQPLTKNRFKTVYAKEQKGPVTAIAHAMGFLVSAVGQKVYIWQLKDNDLVGVAFIDTQVYIHQMLSIKSLILVADVYKSISLLRFQEEYRTLSLVSRDFRPAEIYTIEFLIDNAQMGFLVSDREKNTVLYMYQPESRESFGGQRLLRKADFHIGQHINSFFRIRCRNQPENSIERRLPAGSDKRHLSMYATLDGGLGYILPLPEKTYRRLLMLQNVLVTQVCHTAGLNPKAFRTYKSATRLLGNAARGIVDGELVWSFLNLPATERWEIAKKIGTKVDEVVDDLLDVERLAGHF